MQDARKLAIRKSKEELENFLLENKRARPEMSYSKAHHLFGSADEWRALVEADRREIYKDAMVLLRRKCEEEEHERQKKDRGVFMELLDSLTSIEYRTTWAEAQRVFADCAELKENDDLRNLHKLDQLLVFKDHIRKLEKQVCCKGLMQIRLCALSFFVFSIELIVQTKKK